MSERERERDRDRDRKRQRQRQTDRGSYQIKTIYIYRERVLVT